MLEATPAWTGPGALVQFRTAPTASDKHVGILTGADRFIHACERFGVVEEPLTQRWRRRVALGFLFPERKETWGGQRGRGGPCT